MSCPKGIKSCCTGFNPFSQDISFDFPPLKIPYEFVSYQNNIEIFCSPELAYFLLKEIDKEDGTFQGGIDELPSV
jgi:hypothetical protein